ncbi:major facilitator superfamily transporter glucose [Xylariaceae sp. FL0662B]|nr:major facilitator superfamily transporter glucose [Xylariaceae sp. FL0662B]
MAELSIERGTLNPIEEQDENRLAQFGYKQELKRNWGLAHNFGVSFSIISVITGLTTLFSYGLNTGGPAVMSIGWIVISFFTLTVAIAMAEIVSAIPTSGGPYFWAAMLAPPRYSAFAAWMTGWFNLLGQVAVTTGISFGLANLVATAATVQNPDYEPTAAKTIGIYAAVLMSHGLVNTFGVNVLRYLNNTSIILHSAGVTALCIAVLVRAPTHQSGKFVFGYFNDGTGVDGNPGWSERASPAYVVMCGSLLSQYTLTGFDASAHLSEETRRASWSAPIGVISSVGFSAIFGFLVLMSLLFSIQDFDRTVNSDYGQPVLQIFVDVFGESGALVLFSLIMVCVWHCGLFSMTSNSRMMFAFARDGGIHPFFHEAELNAPQDVISCRVKRSLSTRLSSAFFSPVTRSAAATTTSALPDCIPMNDAQFAVVSSMFTLGGLIGALGSGPVASMKGRLLAMRLTSLSYLIGSVIETMGSAIAVLAIGRVFSGVGAGAATVIVPIYISEIAPPRERGTFGAMTQVSINVGILLTQTMGYFLSYGSAWRWVLAAGVLIAAVQFLGLLVIPESPAWLAANKNVTRARRTLQRIRGPNYNIEEETAAWDSAGPPEEEALLDDTPVQPVAPEGSRRDSTNSKIGGKHNAHLGFFEVIKDPLYRPALIAAVGVMCAQQLCGINSIIMYSVSLLRDLLPINSALLTIMISAINLITTVACSPLPDKLGRKTCLLLSIFGQGASALALALSILFDVKILSAVTVLFFVAFFAVGLGPVPFMLASELVGQEAVGATQSACLGANYIATFLVAQFFPIINVALNEQLGGAGWVYFIFTALAALCGLFVLWRVPETRGKKDVSEVWGRTRRLD